MLSAQICDGRQLRIRGNGEAEILNGAAHHEVFANRVERRGLDLVECGAQGRVTDGDLARSEPMEHVGEIGRQMADR